MDIYPELWEWTQWLLSTSSSYCRTWACPASVTAGICTVVHCAWQDPVQRGWAGRRGVLLLALPESFEKLYSWVIKCRMHWGLIYKVVSISWQLLQPLLKQYLLLQKAALDLFGKWACKNEWNTASCCVALTVRSPPHRWGKRIGRRRAYCCSCLVKQPKVVFIW